MMIKIIDNDNNNNDNNSNNDNKSNNNLFKFSAYRLSGRKKHLTGAFNKFTNMFDKYLNDLWLKYLNAII